MIGVYTVTVVSLFPLGKGNKLFYMFDYGDNWLFKISKSRKSPKELTQGIKYPRIVSETGMKPEQYSALEE